MSLSNEVVVQCPHCQQRTTTTIWATVNVTLDPHLWDAVFDQELNVLNCACGFETRLHHDLLYHDMDRKFQVWLKYPDEDGAITVEGPVAQLAKALSGYRLRIVRSFLDLAEKVTMFEAGLDDRGVEVLKALLDLHYGFDGGDRVDLFFAGVADNGPDGRTLVFVDRATGEADNPVTVKYEVYDEIAARLDPESDRNQWRFVGEAYGSKAAQHFIDEPTSGSSYKVFVDDNFHYMDEDERYLHGEFETREAALQECKRIVDESLQSLYETRMDAEQLFEMYKGFGEDPFIRATGERGGFSAWNYARKRSAEICEQRGDTSPAAEIRGSATRPGTAVGSERGSASRVLRLLSLLAGCWALSVLMVVAGHLRWGYIDISWALASQDLNSAPLIFGFGALSIYAILLPAVVDFFASEGADLTQGVVGTHAMLGWLLLMWVHSQAVDMGRYADPGVIVLFGLLWGVQLATGLVAKRISGR